MSLPENPITRKESFYSVIAGQNDTSILPEPVTREEEYLGYIAVNGGGGGGGGDVTGVKGNAETTYRRGNVNITAANIGAYTKTETDTLLNGKISTTAKGVANGVAGLDANGKVPSANLPSYVDSVVEGYYKVADGKFYEESTYETEIIGTTGVIYVSLDTDKTYRWSGSEFVEISESLALGETSSTAYAGDKGKANADAITAIKDGLTIDSFGDVETALADKISKSQTAGLVKNDGTIDTTTYVSDVSTLQPKTMSASVTIGGTAQTTVESAISALNSVKVDAEQGKGLSTNDYDSTAKTKLDALANIQSIGIGLSLNSTTGELIATGGSISQVQSDWTQTDDTAVDYIKHKPTIPDPITDEKTGTSITLTDAAGAHVQDVVVKGRTESGSSVGDAGWGVLDLGTLTWEYIYGRFQVAFSSLIENFPAAVSQGADGLCSHYVTYKGYSSSMGDKKITISNANFVESYSSIVIKDSAYTDAATFKNAMSGALLYYPLTDATGATPTLGITSKNDVGQGTAATITTGLPLRSNGDVYDELDGDAGVIIKRIDTDGTVLVTPTTVSLTATEKAALANLLTFEGTTHIVATDSPSMTATYILNNDSGKALARVQEDADTQLAGKVDKVQGKGLSTEDYTTAEKTKLAGVATGATANTVFDTTCTLTVAGWTGASAPYTQTVNVTGITANDKPILDISVSSTTATGISEIENWAYVSKAETGAGTITFSCYEDKPDTDMTVNVKVVR